MPKVYITNYNADFSYKLAEEYGETVFMTHGFVPAEQFDQTERRFESYAREATDEDMLLLVGATTVCAIAVAAWLRVHPEVTLLQYTKRRNEEGKSVPAYNMYILRR